MKLPTISICILVSVCTTTKATLIAYPEQMFGTALCYSAESFLKETGNTPQSWSDINKSLARPIEETFDYIHPIERYAFVVPALKLLPPYEGELLIVKRRPFPVSSWYGIWLVDIFPNPRHLRREIFRKTPTGEFAWNKVSEEYIQTTFIGNEALLPVPDNMPELSHRIKARRNARINFVLWLTIPPILCYIGMRRWRSSKAVTVQIHR